VDRLIDPHDTINKDTTKEDFLKTEKKRETTWCAVSETTKHSNSENHVVVSNCYLEYLQVGDILIITRPVLVYTIIIITNWEGERMK